MLWAKEREFESEDNFLCALSQPTPLVFLLFGQFGSMLRENNSSHTLDYCASFGMRVPNMLVQLFIYFLVCERGRIFLCVCANSWEDKDTCVQRWFPYRTTLYTGATIAQIFGIRSVICAYWWKPKQRLSKSMCSNPVSIFLLLNIIGGNVGGRGGGG